MNLSSSATSTLSFDFSAASVALSKIFSLFFSIALPGGYLNAACRRTNQGHAVRLLRRMQYVKNVIFVTANERGNELCCIQPCTEHRQLLDTKGFFDYDKRNFKRG